MVADMKKNIKRFVSLTLAIIMMIALMPELVKEVEANPPAPPTGNVAQRIQQLLIMYPHNSYFSGNDDRCATNHASCAVNNCRLENAMRRRSYTVAQSQQFGDVWTCAAFARFAYWYVFGIVWNASGFNVPRDSREVPLAEARIGDIVMFGVPGAGHWGMYLGVNSSGERIYFHSNAGSGNRTNRVSYETTYTSHSITHVIRANNYDTINQNTITLTRNPTTGGTVTGGGTFPANTNRTVTTTTNAGFIFDGWFENNLRVSSNASFTFTLNSNRNLQARWRDAPRISFNLNGTGIIPTSIPTATTNSAGRLTSLPTPPKRLGFTFAGWFTAQTGGTQVTAGTNGTVFNANATIWARWTSAPNHIPDGIYTIRNRHSGRYLEPETPTNGSPAVQWNQSTTQWSNWIITRQSSDGTYTLRPANASNLYLNVVNASTGNNAPVGVGTFTGHAAQRFDFPRNADGYFFITPSHVLSRALMPLGESQAFNTRIVSHQYQAHWWAQQWALVLVG
jgi:hypothetical protein